jgi:hypothetical protein
MFSVKEKLPDFWNLSKKIASDLRDGKFSYWKPLIQKISPLLEQSFIEKIDKVIPGWEKMRPYMMDKPQYTYYLYSPHA